MSPTGASDVGTVELWRALPVLLDQAPPPRPDRFGARGTSVPGDDDELVDLGWTPPGLRQAWNRADDALRRGSTAIDAVMALPSGGPELARWARTELFASATALRNAAGDAMRAGAVAAGDVLLVLADRAGRAGYAIALWARRAFEAFWGVPPWVFSVGSLALLALLGVAAGVALSTPAAQAFITRAIPFAR